MTSSPMALVLLICSGFSADDSNSRVIDRRTERSELPTHSIVICAREKPNFGHAFVAFISAEPNKKATLITNIGFWPAEGEKTRGAFGPVDGQVANEANKAPTNLDKTIFRVVVHVDPSDFKEARKETERWNGQMYDLTTKNCTHMCHAVLKSLGIGFLAEDPKAAGLNTERPAEYLQRLIRELDP